MSSRAESRDLIILHAEEEIDPSTSLGMTGEERGNDRRGKMG
jgi:hypothetical protein